MCVLTCMYNDYACVMCVRATVCVCKFVFKRFYMGGSKGKCVPYSHNTIMPINNYKKNEDLKLCFSFYTKQMDYQVANT